MSIDTTIDSHASRRSSFTEALGKQLQMLRQARGLTQEQVAYSAEIAVQTYRVLEHGRYSDRGAVNPTLDTILRVLDVLDVSQPQFITDLASAERLVAAGSH